MTAQRNEGKAPRRSRDSRHQQLVIGLAVGAEPGPLEIGELRSHGHQGIHETHARRLARRDAIAREQVTNLVLRIVQDQRYLIELVGGAQSDDEPLEQLRERAGAQQLQLALLCLAQQRIVAADFLGQRRESFLQAAIFPLESGRFRLGRGALPVGHGFGLRLGSAHRASIPLSQARRSFTLRRSCR